MRLLPLIVLMLLAGCAATDYANVPEPTGEWVPANPGTFPASRRRVGNPRAFLSPVREADDER